MDSILPDRLLALVRPGNDLVLPRIQSKTLRAGVCPRGPLLLGPLVFSFLFFLSPAKVGLLEMQPGAKLRRISRGHSARSVLDFESFAGRGHFLDGRLLGACQVE